MTDETRTDNNAAPPPAPAPRRRGRRRQTRVEAAEVDIQQHDSVMMPATGTAQAVRDGMSDIEVPNDMTNIKGKAAMLAFMEEEVTVIIHDSMNDNDEPRVPLGVNGRMIYPFRNVPTKMKRYYVERLARAKPEHVSTHETRDADGNRTMRVDRRRALRYPFSVVEDRNPAGAAWLTQVLNEG